MTILDLSDLHALIEEDVLNDVIELDESRLDTAELIALGEVTGYLSIRYDAPKCLDKSLLIPNPPTHDGYNGISTVIEKLSDITLYIVHSRIMPDNIPKLRQTRYDNAINWLEKVAAGYIAPSLPVKEVSPTTPLRYGNSSQPENKYY